MFLTHAAQLFYDALLTLAYPQAARSVVAVLSNASLELRVKRAGTRRGSSMETETICWKCGVPAEAEVAPELRDEVRCRRCDSQSFTAARAVGLYEGALRESVLLLKRQPHLSQHLEALLVSAAMREPLNTSSQDHTGAASRQTDENQRLQSGLDHCAGVVKIAQVAGGRSESVASVFDGKIPGRAGCQRPARHGRWSL